MVLCASFLLAALAGLSTVNAIPTISVKGSKFFTSDGNQFYVKGKYFTCSAFSETHKGTGSKHLTGIAYQLLPDDPLVDGTQCGLDASLMKTIGTNSIRVYHVDSSANHTSCMNAFADAGSM